MVRRQGAAQGRRAVAAVEFAIVAPVLFGLLLGVWEVGRLVQAQQILSTAAREGARIGAQGLTIASDGTPEEITVTSTDPTKTTVERAVKNYLRQAGIDPTHAQVTFTYLNGDTTKTEPYQATKGQLFRVDVTVPYNDFRWVNLDLTNTVNLKGSALFTSVVDDPFTINTNIPQ